MGYIESVGLNREQICTEFGPAKTLIMLFSKCKVYIMHGLFNL